MSYQCYVSMRCHNTYIDIEQLMKKNIMQKHRTEYNGQLASARFLTLYPRFKQDRTISFAFTDDPVLEKSEDEILRNFERNERNRCD